MKDEVQGIVWGYGGGEVSSDAADKKTSGTFTQGRWAAQESGQKGIERSERDQAASVFQEEFPREIGLAPLDAGAVLVNGKFPEDIVVVQPPALTFQLSADCAEGLQKFEEADVVMALALHDGQRIVGGG